MVPIKSIIGLHKYTSIKVIRRYMPITINRYSNKCFLFIIKHFNLYLSYIQEHSYFYHRDIIKNMNDKLDLVIIGGGPAGISAAIYAARANLKVTIIEERSLGGKLININSIDNYPGFVSISGTDLANNLISHTKEYDIKIINDKVINIDENRILLSKNGQLESKAILIATGSNPRKLDIPYANEFEGKGISYCATCDGFFFKNKNVVVIGNSNQALQESLYLSDLVSKLVILNNKDKLDADSSLINKINSIPNIEILNNVAPIELIIENNIIQGIRIKNIISGNESSIDCSGIFPYISYNPGTDFVDKKILDKNGFIIVNNDMSTSIKGIYAAGDCVSKQLKQVVTACADGAIAATSIIKYLKNQ